MTTVDTDDFDWTEQAARLLSSLDYTAREQQTVAPYCYYQFRSARGKLLAGGPHENRAIAFMSACAAQLRAIGHSHAFTCPHYFAS